MSGPAVATVRHWRIHPTTGVLTPSAAAQRVPEVQWTDLLSEPGTGSIRVRPDDTLLDAFGYDGLDLLQVLVNDNPAWVMWPETIRPATISTSEEAEEAVEVSGRGHLALLDRFQTFPPGGAGRTPKINVRGLGWQHPGYDITGLPTADIMLLTQYAKLTWAGGNPFGGPAWAPDFPLDGFSVIMWADNPGGNPSTYLSADPGQCWFFLDVDYFTDGLFRHFVAADDFMEVFLDSEPILTTNTYLTTTTADVEVSAGTHRIAIHARNGTGTVLDTLPGAYVGPGGFSLAIAQITLIGLNYIGWDNADWKVVAYEDEPPGVPPVTALIVLLDEAEARGCFPIGMSFDTTDDTATNAWDQTGEALANVGDSALDLANALIQTDCDLDMNRDLAGVGLQLDAWRYGEKGTASGDTLAKGTNIREHTSTREIVVGNVALTETDQKWIEVVDTGSVTTYGRAEVRFSLGNITADSEAERVAAGELSKYSIPREEINASVSLTSMVVPYEDAVVGDTVTVPDSTGASDAERLLGITATQNNDGWLEFTCTFRDVVLGPEDRQALTITKVSI